MERSESLGARCGEGGSIFREERARGHQGSPVGRAVPTGWQGLIQTQRATQPAQKDRHKQGSRKREYRMLENYGLETRRNMWMGYRLYPSCSVDRL